MLGILWFFLWQSAGIAVSYYLFPEKRIAVRLWLGSVIGTLLSMWAPIPFAFLRGFSITAHIAAAIFALALHALWFARREKAIPCAEDAAIDRTATGLAGRLPGFQEARRSPAFLRCIRRCHGFNDQPLYCQ